MDNEWITVADQLPPGTELVETRIGDGPGPNLVCYDGMWLTVIDVYDGPTPTHWRRIAPPGCLTFRDLTTLYADFEAEVTRWLDRNRRS